MRKLLGATIALTALATTSLAADPVSLRAEHDAAAPNFFTLDFGDGTPRTAQISDTTYDLRLDELSGEARFVSYLQFIDPIEIPIAPGVALSTGDITVEIVPGSGDPAGSTYDAKTGEFATAETYRISFTGDLSPIGFFSPVDLPSNSTGTVAYDNTGTAGSIGQDWEGSVELFPGQFLNYQCRVSTTFQQRFVGDLNCDAGVNASDISAFVTALTNPDAFGSQFPNCDIALADVNGDGRVTVSDITGFVDLLTN